MRKPDCLLLLALLSGGCAGYQPPRIGPENPASPEARESRFQPAKPALDADADTLTRETNKELQGGTPETSRAARPAPGEMTAEGAVRIALRNNRGLQAQFEEIGITKADLLEAGLYPNPTFAASPRFPDTPPLSADVELSAAGDFLDLLLRSPRKRVAAMRVEQTRLRASDAVLKLAAEVKTAFYTLQAAQSLVERIQAITAAEAAALDLLQRQHRAGTAGDLALAGQQTAYSQDRLEQANAAADIREKRERLNSLLGLWGDATGWKTAALPAIPAQDPPLTRLESLAITRRPDIAESKAEILALAQALGMSKSFRYIGNLQFGVDTERETSGQRITGPTFSLELPVFNHGQGRIAKLEAQLRQAERNLEERAIAARAEVRAARDRLLAKRDAALFYRDELLPERARITRLSQVQYNAMLLGAYDLLQAKQNQLGAERASIEARRDYWIARADLERAIGR